MESRNSMFKKIYYEACRTGLTGEEERVWSKSLGESELRICYEKMSNAFNFTKEHFKRSQEDRLIDNK